MMYVEHTGEKVNAWKFPVECGKKRPLRGPRHRCENIRKMHINERISEGVGCIRLFQEREMWPLLVHVSAKYRGFIDPFRKC